ncbi:MAG TPA: hypothetical protein VGD98_22955 [Ktedonobacteraceae bacterium]
MAIQEIETTELTSDIAIDTTKDKSSWDSLARIVVPPAKKK